VGVASPPFVDVTIDGDASSSCTTSDDVTVSDDVISNPGSDVTECPQPVQAQPAAGNSAWSVDSGHCSGASDDPVTSSDTETLDAGSEDDHDDDDVDVTDDNESPVTSDTLGRSSSATVRSCDNISILDLLSSSERVTDL